MDSVLLAHIRTRITDLMYRILEEYDLSVEECNKKIAELQAQLDALQSSCKKCGCGQPASSRRSSTLPRLPSSQQSGYSSDSSSRASEASVAPVRSYGLKMASPPKKLKSASKSKAADVVSSSAGDSSSTRIPMRPCPKCSRMYPSGSEWYDNHVLDCTGEGPSNV